jgi:hypothetical protein
LACSESLSPQKKLTNLQLLELLVFLLGRLAGWLEHTQRLPFW